MCVCLFGFKMHVSCVILILFVFCGVIPNGFSQSSQLPEINIDVSELCPPPKLCVVHSQCLSNESRFFPHARNVEPKYTVRHSNNVLPRFTAVQLRNGVTAQMCKTLETCCGEDAIQVPSPTPDVEVNVNKECGIRNPEGILLHVKTNDAGVSQYGEFPWTMALIRNNPSPKEQKLMCGGSLIHPSVVLTAAHCVHRLRNKLNDFIVRAGEWDTQIEIEPIRHHERTVTEIIVHENFDNPTLIHDIALLMLAEPFNLRESIQTICLPARDFNSDGQQACYASGWCAQNFQNSTLRTAIMEKVQLPVVSHSTCQTQLRTLDVLGNLFQLHNSFICAGGIQGQETCIGNGGSPLVCPYRDQLNRYYQTGIAAAGIRYGTENFPGLYTDVAKHRDWIDRQMSLKNYSF